MFVDLVSELLGSRVSGHRIQALLNILPRFCMCCILFMRENIMLGTLGFVVLQV